MDAGIAVSTAVNTALWFSIYEMKSQGATNGQIVTVIGLALVAGLAISLLVWAVMRIYDWWRWR